MGISRPIIKLPKKKKKGGELSKTGEFQPSDELRKQMAPRGRILASQQPIVPGMPLDLAHYLAEPGACTLSWEPTPRSPGSKACLLSFMHLGVQSSTPAIQ